MEKTSLDAYRKVQPDKCLVIAPPSVMGRQGNAESSDGLQQNFIRVLRGVRMLLLRQKVSNESDF